MTLLKKIVDESLKIFQSENEIYFAGLFEGLSGILLYLGYLKDINYNSGIDTLFDRYFARLVEVFTETNHLTNFANGLAGTSWVLKHLHNKQLIVLDIEEDLGEIDRLIEKSLAQDFLKNNYDLLYGYIGKLISLGMNNTISNPDLLSNALRTLQQHAIINNKGIFWEDFDNPGTINLGVPHGMPGIISFICDCKKSGIPNTERLIMDATRWMLSIETRDGLWSFPNGITSDFRSDEFQSRLAWCYGDLGIAFSLLKASHTLGDNVIFYEARRVAQKTLHHETTASGITKISGTHYLDVGLCHGTASVALMYRRIWELTSDKKFQDASNYWVVKTSKELLKQLQDFNAIPEGRQTFENIVNIKKYGFIEGITGPLLLVLSNHFSRYREWEKVLLLN